MARSYAIVAIPSRDDYVWRISSEKVPHLTLLFLGEELENEKRVEEFIDHTIDTSLSKFVLEVDRRGVLGDHSADVLFFNKYGIDKLKDIRSYFLTDPDVFKAYSSAEQFPSWTPHLTLGYPETPAKTDKRDYLSMNAILFDRIALWTGDYEGVEFPLDNDAAELHMTAAKGESFLEHFGVKGMKWGVIRDRLSGGTSEEREEKRKQAVKSATEREAVQRDNEKIGRVRERDKQRRIVDLMPSNDAKTAKRVKVKAQVSGVNTLTNSDLQTLITRMNLERQYKDLKQVEQADSVMGKGKRWAGNFVSDVLKDAAASWLKRPGSNFSGRTSAQAYSWGKQVAGALEGSIVQPRAIER